MRAENHRAKHCRAAERSSGGNGWLQPAHRFSIPNMRATDEAPTLRAPTSCPRCAPTAQLAGQCAVATGAHRRTGSYLSMLFADLGLQACARGRAAGAELRAVGIRPICAACMCGVLVHLIALHVVAGGRRGRAVAPVGRCTRPPRACCRGRAPPDRCGPSRLKRATAGELRSFLATSGAQARGLDLSRHWCA